MIGMLDAAHLASHRTCQDFSSASLTDSVSRTTLMQTERVSSTRPVCALKRWISTPNESETHEAARVSISVSNGSTRSHVNDPTIRINYAPQYGHKSVSKVDTETV